ncbi:hypothetical protein HOLleu_32543 [Holothuria leucospilota]|uniref:Uncharacterized protein n=1 Tax=Holothuria leucospilota TaxID=206669 RepID=A0A9Q1BIV0_HOLLE|nr:hypothetical protein HOLleu_32543 [Holothuria leucospilota]
MWLFTNAMIEHSTLAAQLEQSAGEDDEVKALKETTAKKEKTLTKVAALKKLAKKQRNTKVRFKNGEVRIKVRMTSGGGFVFLKFAFCLYA